MDDATLEQLRKDIVFSERLRGHQFSFHTTWGLFSPKGIDEGTRLLLEHIDIRHDERALDLGCGYGPIGLTIARVASAGHCTMVDKDFVAVEYARRNAALNGLDNVSVRLSDGFRHLDQQRFTLVASNLPAKTTKEHYYLFFNDALQRLEYQGRICVVVISGLRHFVKRAFVEVFGNYSKIKQGKVYTVAMAEKLH